MSQGKFSNPRPHREEEREIEKAYRDLTRKNNPTRSRREHPAQELSFPEDALSLEKLSAQVSSADMPATEKTSVDTLSVDTLRKETSAETVPNPAAEDRQIEDAFQKVTGRSVSYHPAPKSEYDVPVEETPEPQRQLPAWLGEVVEFYKKNTKLVLAALCALALMLIVFVIVLFARSASDPYGSKILSNVYIADVNVGGMTKKEAIDALNAAFGDVYTTQDMVIDLSGTELRLTPKDSGASVDAAGAVEEAYAYGRTGTQSERDAIYKASKKESYNIAILPYLNLKTENIRKFLTEKSENAGGTLLQTSYGLEGEEPELSAEKFDENAPCQTLVITMGKPGVGFDPDDVYNQVLDAYSQRIFLVTVEDVETLKDPDPIDLEKIYKEFYIEPVNATVNTQTGKTTSGSYGYGFDLDAAQKLVDEAEFGEEIRIPMEYIEPDILDAKSFFQDTLGEYQTRSTGGDSRSTNLRLACQALDGTVLNPGETLSFLNAVGKLSASNGYQSAPEDTGMESTVGGGAAQVSSTLYCAALLSDLTVTSRTNLAQMPSYIGSGLDADTSLTLKNTGSYPVRINAQYSGGYVRISISGTEDRDYYRMLGSEIVNTYKAETEYVKYDYDNSEGIQDGDVLQEGRDGYQAKSYSVRYSLTTDQKITTDYIATSNYSAVKQQIALVDEYVEPTEETEEETEPPTESEEEPTEEATEESKEEFYDDDLLVG